MKYWFTYLILGTIGALSFLPPEDPNPYTSSELGAVLFFEKMLSKDSTISCASCHIPEFAFADTARFSLGVNDSLGTRNTPSVMNMSSRSIFFYDGRSETLELQAKEPIENPLEMHLDYNIAVQRIQNDSNYIRYFAKVYGEAPDSANILLAIADYIRTLESNGSAPHDLWMLDVENALTPAQERGRNLFLEKAKCFDCHFGPDFTGDEFRNIGIYDEVVHFDKGRFDITKDTIDLGKFKVPGLRNVALTPPYMHNGMFQTLEEVVEYYDNPYQFIPKPINIDSLMIEPLGLTLEEKSDLVQYLHALTDESFSY